jgi:acylphosphatase
MALQRGSRMESRDEEGTLESWLVRVSGRVQGIGYRDACVRRARAAGITGWVRNRMDDSVEAMLQGAPEQLADMCDWLRDGMPAALVDDLQVVRVQPPFARFDRFDRLPTL